MTAPASSARAPVSSLAARPRERRGSTRGVPPTRRSCASCELPGKGPLLQVPRPYQKTPHADREKPEAEEDDEPAGRREDEEPAGERDERGHGIQPDAVRPRQIRPSAPQQDEAADLPDELDQNAGRDERVDHRT